MKNKLLITQFFNTVYPVGSYVKAEINGCMIDVLVNSQVRFLSGEALVLGNYGNTQNGIIYLSWVFIPAAEFEAWFNGAYPSGTTVYINNPVSNLPHITKIVREAHYIKGFGFGFVADRRNYFVDDILGKIQAIVTVKVGFNQSDTWYVNTEGVIVSCQKFKKEVLGKTVTNLVNLHKGVKPKLDTGYAHDFVVRKGVERLISTSPRSKRVDYVIVDDVTEANKEPITPQQHAVKQHISSSLGIGGYMPEGLNRKQKRETKEPKKSTEFKETPFKTTAFVDAAIMPASSKEITVHIGFKNYMQGKEAGNE